MVANPIPAGESRVTDMRMLGKHDPKKVNFFWEPVSIDSNQHLVGIQLVVAGQICRIIN
jgi:hypothetical protein